MQLTKKPMTAQLPPTICTEELRERIVNLAAEQGKSIAEIQREALEFFLQSNDSKSIEKDSVNI